MATGSMPATPPSLRTSRTAETRATMRSRRHRQRRSASASVPVRSRQGNRSRAWIRRPVIGMGTARLSSTSMQSAQASATSYWGVRFLRHTPAGYLALRVAAGARILCLGSAPSNTRPPPPQAGWELAARRSWSSMNPPHLTVTDSARPHHDCDRNARSGRGLASYQNVRGRQRLMSLRPGLRNTPFAE